MNPRVILRPLPVPAHAPATLALALMIGACTPPKGPPGPGSNPAPEGGFAELLAPAGNRDPGPEPAPDTAERAPVPEPEPEAAPPPEPAHAHAPAPAGPGGLMAGMLEAHNQFRRAHCAAPLTWSETLARDARAWADHLRDSGCGLAHDNQTRQGENLAMFTPSGRVAAAEVAAGWYGEEVDYDYQKPGFSPSTGHFTQVVWQDSKELGCAVVQCGRADIWVCRYHPSGNYRGQYRDRVLAKTCR